MTCQMSDSKESAYALWLNVHKGNPVLAKREKQVLHGFYPSKQACEIAGRWIAKSHCTKLYTVTHECAPQDSGEWVKHDN